MWITLTVVFSTPCNKSLFLSSRCNASQSPNRFEAEVVLVVFCTITRRTSSTSQPRVAAISGFRMKS